MRQTTVKKFLSCIVSLALLAPPSAFSGEWNPLTSIPAVSETQVQDAVTTDAQKAKATQTPELLAEPFDTATFLENKNPLAPMEELDYEFERYAFEDALELFRPEYAAAVVLEGLDARELTRLIELPFEVGIIVLHGEIVLFSSGSEDEIGILPAVRELTEKASLITHTHPTLYSVEGPSGQDLNEASEENPEYVITPGGVYTYLKPGVLNDGKPYAYEEFIQALNQAVLESEDSDVLQARKDLNQFIASQDLYNHASELEKETFRSGGTISYTSSLTSASVTTLPGSPYPYFMEGTSPTSTLSVNYDGRFKLNYDVRAANSYSGMTISFDDASSTSVETRDLSVLGSIVFGLQGSAKAVKVEFVDVKGNKDAFTLTNVSSSQRFWRINTSNIISSVDKTQIKQINLYVNQSMVSSNKRTGALYIHAKGLNVSAPQIPTVNAPSITSQTSLMLTGTKEAQTAIFIDGVQALSRDNSTTWSATVNLSSEGTNTFNVQAKNSIGKLSTVRSVSIIRDTLAPVITVSGLPAGNQIDVPYLVIPYHITDSNPQITEGFASFDLAPGVNDLVIPATDLAGNQSSIHLLITYNAPENNLTSQEKTLRQTWLEANFSYFTESQGIDPATGFPVDVIGSNAPAGIFWTQPTSIGFYLNFLANVISKRAVLSSFSQAAALAAAEKTLASLLDVQTRFGWQGLIPWLRLDGTLRANHPEIGLIDNANLTHHLAVLLGLLEKGNLQQTIAGSVYDKAKTFIDRQGEGYNAFIDPLSGLFRAVYRTDAGIFDGYADRFGSEVRATLPFLIEYYGLNSAVFSNLIKTVSAYPTLQGRTVKTFSAFDGGAFQYFWPLLVSPEEALPEIAGALQNALLIFSDFMERKALAGFPSAASLPEGGYGAKLGINFLKETADFLDEEVASIYALASAYRLNPSWVISKISEIAQSFPALGGPLGFYDSMRTGGGVSQNYYAIDQGSFLLGLMGTGAVDFQAFMEKRNLWAGYTTHYSNLSLDILQAVPALPEPAVTAGEIAARDADSEDLYRSGIYDYDGITGNGIEATQTSSDIFTYRKTAPSGWIGGWVTPAFDRNAHDYVVIEARSLTAGNNQVRFELKNFDNFILQQDLKFEGTGWHSFQFFFSKDTAPINFAAFTGATSDFEIRALYFTDTPIFQIVDDLYSSGLYDYDGVTGNGLAVSQTSPGVYTYTKTASSGWIGGFVTPAFDRNPYAHAVIQIRSLSLGDNQVRLELKNDGNYILNQVINLEDTEWQSVEFYFPSDTPPINFIAFSDATSNFEVRALYFTDNPPSQMPVFSNTPSIVQTSPATTSNSHYLLTYMFNGFPRSEWVELVPGQNTIRRTFVDALGRSFFYDFHVDLA